MEFGEIVDGAVQLYRRDFALYYLVALVGAAPGYAVLLAFRVDATSVLLALEGDAAASAADVLPFASALVLDAAAGFVATVAVTVAIARRVSGRPATVAASYARAFAHLPRAAGAALLSGGLLALLLVLAVAAFAVLWPVAAPILDDAAAALALGAAAMAFAALAGLFWAGATFGIVPAVVMEGRSAVGALARSFGLFRGGWGRVLGICVVALIIRTVPSFAVQALFGLDLLASPESIATVGPERQWLMNTANFALEPLTLPFAAAAIVTLFHDRRVRLEAYDLESRAESLEPR